jgi:predicted transposase YbfD/YdcC
VIQDIDWLPQKSKWKKLTCLIEVKSNREWMNNEKKESATRRFISSRKGTASDFGKWVRNHWHIENNCHWVADVIFKEDSALANRGYSAENLGIFRRVVMNIASVVDPKRGLASIRRAATFGTGYLKGVLAKIFL